MEKIRKFYRYVDFVAVFTALFVEEFLREHIESLRSMKSSLLILCSAIIIAIITMHLFEAIAERLIKSSLYIRRKIWGKDFVEGTWFDIIEKDGVDRYGLFTISYSDESLLLVGELYNLQGKRLNTWASYMSEMRDQTLRVMHTIRYTDKVEELFGMCVYDFIRSPHSKELYCFNAYYISISTNFRRNSFTGMKITNKNFLERLGDPKTKFNAMKLLAQSEYFSKEQCN